MKKIYTIAFVTCLLIFSGCSKDFLKSYDDRIVGEWSISKVNRVGFGGSTGIFLLEREQLLSTQVESWITATQKMCFLKEAGILSKKYTAMSGLKVYR